MFFTDSAKTLRRWPGPTPSAEVPGGGICSANKTMPLEGKTAPSWWGCLCPVLSWPKAFRVGVFYPAGMDLAVKLLNNISSTIEIANLSKDLSKLQAPHLPPWTLPWTSLPPFSDCAGKDGKWQQWRQKWWCSGRNRGNGAVVATTASKI